MRNLYHSRINKEILNLGADAAHTITSEIATLERVALYEGCELTKKWGAARQESKGLCKDLYEGEESVLGRLWIIGLELSKPCECDCLPGRHINLIGTSIKDAIKIYIDNARKLNCMKRVSENIIESYGNIEKAIEGMNITGKKKGVVQHAMEMYWYYLDLKINEVINGYSTVGQLADSIEITATLAQVNNTVNYKRRHKVDVIESFMSDAIKYAMDIQTFLERME